MAEFICENCGRRFTRGRAKARFCSRECCYAAGGSARLTVAEGKDNPRYNGGLCFSKRLGRWVIHCRDHSLVYFYRAVVEADLGRHLHPSELVHHKNEDPSDDRLENLQLTNRADHARLHMKAAA